MNYLIFIGFLICGFFALKRPLLGLSLYYFTALLKPDLIWPNLFGGMRLNLYAAIITFIGLFLAWLNKGENNTYSLKGASKLFGFKALLLILVFVNISYFFSNPQFSEYSNNELGFGAHIAAFNTMILFAFVTVTYIRTNEQFVNIILVFMGIELLLVYWSNSTFLFYGYSAFTSDGRMPGPNGQDENIFAARLIIGLPFLMYAQALTKNVKLRLLTFSTIPFYWHAIFLTGSRGGMIALAIVTLLFAYKIGNKKIGLAISTVFIILVISQAAPMIQRINTTLQEVDSSYSEESNPRLESWSAGIRMIADNAFFGVGFERFQQAASSYGYDKHYVAHNTLIQFAANSGLIPAIAYLFFVFSAVIHIIARKEAPTTNAQKLALAAAISLVGLFTCSFFLNLVLYEMTYFVISLYCIGKGLIKHEGNNVL